MKFDIDNELISYNDVIEAFVKGNTSKDDFRQYFSDKFKISQKDYNTTRNIKENIDSVINYIDEGRLNVCYQVDSDMTGCVLGNIPYENLIKAMTMDKFARHSDISDIDLKFIANAQFDGREQNDVFRISHIIADDGYTKDIEFPVDDVYVALHDTKPVLNFFIPEMCKERDYMPSHRNVVMELPAVNNEFISESTYKFTETKNFVKNVIDYIENRFDTVMAFEDTKNGLSVELREWKALPDVITTIDVNTNSKTPFSDFMNKLDVVSGNITDTDRNNAEYIVEICNGLCNYPEINSKEVTLTDVSHKLDVEQIAFNRSAEDVERLLGNRFSSHITETEFINLYKEENSVNKSDMCLDI